MATKSPVLITGANGFVGSHLAELLLHSGHEVRCILRAKSNSKWLKDLPVKIYRTGLTDLDALKEPLIGVKYVYHIAGVVKAKQYQGFIDGNVKTTEVLLKACVKYNPTVKRVLIISSLAACGPSGDRPIIETDELKPVSEYGKSKKEQEELVSTFLKQLPITVIRPPAVYGPRETDILVYFKTVNRSLNVQIGSHEKVLSLVHVSDLVRGMEMASKSERSLGQTYFIGSNQKYRWREIAQITAEALNKKTISVTIPNAMVYVLATFTQLGSYFSPKPPTLNLKKVKELIQPSWVCSSQKAFDHFGYRQKISLEDGLRETLQWYQQKNWL